MAPGLPIPVSQPVYIPDDLSPFKDACLKFGLWVTNGINASCFWCAPYCQHDSPACRLMCPEYVEKFGFSPITSTPYSTTAPILDPATTPADILDFVNYHTCPSTDATPYIVVIVILGVALMLSLLYNYKLIRKLAPSPPTRQCSGPMTTVETQSLMEIESGISIGGSGSTTSNETTSPPMGSHNTNGHIPQPSAPSMISQGINSPSIEPTAPSNISQGTNTESVQPTAPSMVSHRTSSSESEQNESHHTDAPSDPVSIGVDTADLPLPVINMESWNGYIVQCSPSNNLMSIQTCLAYVTMGQRHTQSDLNLTIHDTRRRPVEASNGDQSEENTLMKQRLGPTPDDRAKDQFKRTL